MTYAQEGMPATVRPCGTDRLLEQWRKNASFLERERAINRALLQQHYIRVPGAPAVDPAVITLPVVVHIINENMSAYTDLDVANAIQALNEAYSASGAFTGGRTDTKIRFCLAKTAPDGGRTTGIIRTYSYLSDFDVDMEGGEITAMGAWDRSRYINIWVVSTIRSDYMQDFSCGKWSRLTMGGYASAGGDIVVGGLGVDLVAHEMGHYLSLAHTFAARDCKNDDCLTDGDMVCDTPPEKTITGGYACSVPQNSCSTDTLSGFTIDVPDLPDNFMDYGPGTGCILGFTLGQAERMRNFITAALPLMQPTMVCNDPCGAAVTASFTRDIAYPVVGDVVTFTAVSAPGQTLQWLVDGVPAGTGTTLALTVTDIKTYLLELRVTDNVSGCHASTTDAMPVSCGVVARFYPDKRKIASKEGVETDHVIFTNRSRNATSWKWLISNDKGMAEQVVSTDEQLDYIFKTPGNYKVRLYATDGHCEDYTNPVTIIVDDPTADGLVYVSSVECYQQDKLRVKIYFENRGYKTIPKGTPVSFYDDDPRAGKGHRLGIPFLLPDDLPGKCVSVLYTTIVDAARANIDTLVTVMNDNGSTFPLALPNTVVEELNYGNNVSIKKGFRFRVSLAPGDYTLTPQEQLVLKPVSAGGAIATATWESSPYLDCINCINATFTAPYRLDTVTTVKVRAYSKYACFSDTMATIHIPVVDDYSVKLNNVDCSRGDSLHVDFSLCNAYTKGNVPASLQVDFYDRAPGDPAAIKLGNSFITPMATSGACSSNYGQYIHSSATGKVLAIVNKDRLKYPPATGLNESVYDNNTYTWDYIPPVLSVFPKDTTVFRKAPFNLYYGVTGFTPVSLRWDNSDAYTLSCYTCASPVAKMLDSSMVGIQMANQYGCVLKAEQYVHIFPPDMTVALLSANCYDNDHILVKFRICMSNGYDSVFQKIPVSFYNGDPADPTTRLLLPRYYTPAPEAGDCREFTYVLNAPGTNKVTALVNEKEGFVFNETNYKNNRSDLDYEPFAVTAAPDLITLPRPANVKLHTTVSGGIVTSYLWEPQSGLSCTGCADPVAAATSSMKYRVTVANNYYCTDTAYVQIKTFVGAGITMPNAFSPNGDGQNDYFYVIGNLDIQKVKNLSIFNRAGNKIFEAINTPANDRSYGWDGTFNGQWADIGTYVYFATIEFTDGSVQIIKGTVTLIR
ncbi:MAG TPA: gliding motility-associated C-terminal domain-containing protein [Chitinophaga sp.]|uniref:T9SS type B sorting domain-containing protein n=1 Tax=Chitinophaga sp. TaxID=1869181 RepID=UPI002CD32EDD|nr:gliding motility-associated C-terminal domain-containing protein [Chitinophaga sp.]HVI46101.1 gliding motility-associated C-terminal domain-containing protein [Chitinophaga sp.]